MVSLKYASKPRLSFLPQLTVSAKIENKLPGSLREPSQPPTKQRRIVLRHAVVTASVVGLAGDASAHDVFIM